MDKTTDDVYERLARALDDLPNGFPRTSLNIEIKILKKIFSLQEAFLASHLGRKMGPTDSIANRCMHGFGG